MLCFDESTNQYFIASDEQVKIVENQMIDVLKRMISEGKEIITLSEVMDALGVENRNQSNDDDQKKGAIVMAESIKWSRTKQLTKDQFCELTRTPKDWHIFKECDQIEFYECDYLGRTYWRCDTKDTLWMFTKVDDEIWFKIKDRYDQGPYWSEWHDWS